VAQQVKPWAAWEWVGPMIVVIGAIVAAASSLFTWYDDGTVAWIGVHTTIGQEAGILGVVAAAAGAFMFIREARKAMIVVELLIGFSGLIGVLVRMGGRIHASNGIFTPDAGLYVLGTGIVIMFIGLIVACSPSGAVRFAIGSLFLLGGLAWGGIAYASDSSTRTAIENDGGTAVAAQIASQLENDLSIGYAPNVNCPAVRSDRAGYAYDCTLSAGKKLFAIPVEESGGGQFSWYVQGSPATSGTGRN
jgi:hypothetical protein